MWVTSPEHDKAGLSGCLACRQTPRGLSDWPFEWYVKWLWGAEYDQVVLVVHDNVEIHHYGWSLFPPGKCGIHAKCFPYDVTQTILNAYLNLATNGDIDEFDEGPLNEGTPDDLKPYLPSDWWSWATSKATYLQRMQRTVNETAKAAGVAYELALWHLQALYRLSKDRTIPKGFLYLWPRRSMKYAEVRKLPPDAASLDKAAEDIASAVSGAVTWAKWVIPAALIVTGGVILSRFIPDEKKSA